MSDFEKQAEEYGQIILHGFLDAMEKDASVQTPAFVSKVQGYGRDVGKRVGSVAPTRAEQASMYAQQATGQAKGYARNLGRKMGLVAPTKKEQAAAYAQQAADAIKRQYGAVSDGVVQGAQRGRAFVADNAVAIGAGAGVGTAAAAGGYYAGRN